MVNQRDKIKIIILNHVINGAAGCFRVTAHFSVGVSRGHWIIKIV